MMNKPAWEFVGYDGEAAIFVEISEDSEESEEDGE